MAVSRTYHVMFLALVFLTVADAFDNGAPFSTCYTRYPKHSGHATQPAPSPFQITFSQSSYTPGAEMSITIKDPSNQTFHGLQIAAFRETGNPEEVVGQFTQFPADKVKAFSCFGGYKNMVTHKQKETFHSVSLMWKAPTENVGNITFKATVVVDYDVFWTNIEAKLPTSSSAPVVDLKYQIITPTKLITDIDFDACGETKGCFLYPRHCDGDDCVAAATFQHRPATDDYLFELFASSARHYISLAFSDDKEMGVDETASCISNSGQAGVQHGWNPHLYNERQVNRFINEAEIRQADGKLHCRFVLPAKSTVYVINHDASDFQYKNISYDRNKEYHLQLAWGKVMPGSDVMSMHKDMPAVTSDKVSLTDKKIYYGSAFHVLVKVHAAVMIIAWVLIGGLVTVISRHYKNWLPKSRLFGTKIWFQVHRELAILIVILTAIGLAVIFAHYGSELRTTYGPHSIVGLVVTAVLGLQVIAGFLRPGADSKWRVYFNWGHRISGQVAHILAAVAMFLAFDLDYITDDMRTFGIAVLSIWVAVQLAWHIVYEILTCRGLPFHVSKDTEPEKETNGACNTASLLLMIYAVFLVGLCCAVLVAFLLF